MIQRGYRPSWMSDGGGVLLEAVVTVVLSLVWVSTSRLVCILCLYGGRGRVYAAAV